jgi:hypothetical protein
MHEGYWVYSVIIVTKSKHASNYGLEVTKCKMQPRSEKQTQRMHSTYNLLVPMNSSCVRKFECSNKRKSNLITSAALSDSHVSARCSGLHCYIILGTTLFILYLHIMNCHDCWMYESCLTYHLKQRIHFTCVVTWVLFSWLRFLDSRSKMGRDVNALLISSLLHTLFYSAFKIHVCFRQLVHTNKVKF